MVIYCRNQVKSLAYLDSCLPPIAYKRISGGMVTLDENWGNPRETTGTTLAKGQALYEFLVEKDVLKKFIEKVFHENHDNYIGIGSTFGKAFPLVGGLHSDINWGELAYQNSLNFSRRNIRNND